MVMRRPATEQPFEDYYYILDLPLDADALAIDEAYWRLAREYNRRLRSDPTARVTLDGLNEAYRVLASAKLRREYDKLRNAMLGEGALPQPPRETRMRPPLMVMERQHPKPRAVAPAALRSRWAALPSARAASSLLMLVIIVGLATLTYLR